MTFERDYHQLRDHAGCVRQSCEVVVISGPDAQTYLAGQLSCDVDGLDVGQATHSFVLQPSGKVASYGRLHRASEQRFVLEFPSGWGEITQERLERFWLRVDCELTMHAWQMCCFRGPDSVGLAGAGLAATDAGTATPDAPEVLVAEVRWGQLAGFDLLGPQLDLSQLEAMRLPGEIPECDPQALEVLRVEAGIAQLGREIMPDSIPAEAGQKTLEQAVSFTKGCYVGQELVERMHARQGGAPQRLLGVRFGADAPAAPAPPTQADPAQLYHQGQPKAQITTQVNSPRLGAIALALVHRSVNPKDVLSTQDGQPAEICELPFQT